MSGGGRSPALFSLLVLAACSRKEQASSEDAFRPGASSTVAASPDAGVTPTELSVSARRRSFSTNTAER